MKIKLVRIAK
jgi:hypothetical protein